LGFPLLPESLRPPYYESALRNLHKIISDALTGDEKAAEKLAILRARFARDPLA
jgi:hypothetical protein